MKYLIISVFLIFSLRGGADEDNDENEQFGKEKAITEVRNKGEEFKLSKESFDTLGIVLTAIEDVNETDRVMIPKSSLVKFMNMSGIYTYRNGWFKLLKLKIVREIDNNYDVLISGIQIDDKFVTKNVGLVRIAHIHASGGLSGIDLD